MKAVLVDSNIILDVFLNDPAWADRSETALEKIIAKFQAKNAMNRIAIEAMSWFSSTFAYAVSCGRPRNLESI